MGASIFSFLMSLFWCSIFILVGIMWRKVMTLKHGTGFTLIVIAIGILRLFLPLDLPVSVIIRSTSVMPEIQRFFDNPAFSVCEIPITPFNVIIIVWVTGSAIYLILLALSLVCQSYRIKAMHSEECSQARKILDQIVLTSRPKQSYSLVVSKQVATPMMAGYFHPTVLLPPLELSDEEMEYVLLHEWNHFVHGHLWIKLLFNIFCAILWWNPLVYLAKGDLDYILEVNCDRYVVRNFDDAQRTHYVEATTNILKQLVHAATQNSMASVGFVSTVPGMIIQRCELILFPPKKLGRIARSSLLIFIIFLTILSYAFIFQTAYTPSQEELQNITCGSLDSNISLNISPKNSYLVLNSDETYTLYVNGDPFDILEKSEISALPFSELPIK